MIIQLNNNYNKALMKYLKQESEINLFIIGDIENYGYDKNFQEIWGQINDDGLLIAVLLRFHHNLIFYSRDKFDINGFYNIMKNIDFKALSGEKSIIEKFQYLFDFSKKSDMHFCKLDDISKLKNINLNTQIKQLNLDKVESIIKLHQSIAEFDNFPLEIVKRHFESGRSYCIEEDDEVVSIAQTTAENSISAMIIGVCTHPNYRKKGYASACVSHLCKDLLKENKTLCLFYDNPKAGEMYKKLGFEDIGTWTCYNP
ncbi:GNAT family N-acetyltransferase [Tepidibacter hydrothermalis]|uniref:GNAT family N-acetyltransferase n=1 Tax=Tepidibacter hydrothermalis TaxID=3036126 RepID=A0ABY8EEN2_9FIRM|nr:GNAT family N-acetyltransferase [Tepidibacter hydrothermalis]WFD10345.1 GNAT family N-acetyltransferase [Tepidibacter hydrothermalis]